MSERLNAYAKPSPRGGITVDVEGMSLDLIMVMKAGGTLKEDFIRDLSKMWDECKVSIEIPKGHKQ